MQLAFQGVLPSLINGAANYDQIAQEIFTARSPFPSSFFYSYPATSEVPTSPTFDYSKFADTSKFVTTIFSGTFNLSRSGSKRMNLNKVVTTSTVATAIRQQLDQIISTVNFHLPNFGQRFYRTGTDKNSSRLNATDKTIYLNKVAANVRDYIDTDSQPTVINNDCQITPFESAQRRLTVLWRPAAAPLGRMKSSRSARNAFQCPGICHTGDPDYL